MLLSMTKGSREYLPELDAENTKIRMHAFRMPGKCGIPLKVMATTKGLAAAELGFLLEEVLAAINSGEL